MNVNREIIKFVKHYQKILKYFACSVFTACLETMTGWILLHITSYGIVVANTAAVIFGAIVHYFITLLMVFEKRNNAKSFLVYVFTFILGLVLQNVIIWMLYEKVLFHMDEFLKYILSKGLSLVVPFFLLYFIRMRLNQMIAGYDLK